MVTGVDKNQLILALGTVVSLFAIIVGVEVVSPLVALYGLYIPLGLAIAFLLARFSFGSQGSGLYQDIDSSRVVKVIGICVAMSIAVSALGYRWMIFPFSAIGLGSLGLSLFSGSAEYKSVLGAVMLLSVQPISRGLNTGFYFGTGDLIRDIQRANGLLEAQSTTGIGGIYEFYPGAFLNIGLTYRVAGWPVIQSAEAVAFVTGLTFLLMIYLLARQAIGSAARWVLVFGIALPTLSRSLSVYHAQQLGIVLALLSLYFYFAFKVQTNRTVGLTLLAVGSLAITHHLTVVLLVPPLLLWFGGLARDPDDQLGRHGASVLTSSLIIGVYWIYLGETFIRRMIITMLIHLGAGSSLFYDFDVGSSNKLLWGDPITPSEPLQHLINISPSLAVYTALVSVFSLGSLALLQGSNSDKGWLGAGMVSASGTFPTPVSYRILTRLAYVSIPFFLGVVAKGTDEFKRSPNAKRALIALIVVAGMAGPYIAADDLDNDRGQPRAYSNGEMQQLSGIGSFADGMTVESFWVTEEMAATYFGMSAPTEPLSVSEEGVGGEGLFVVRRASAGNQIVVERGGGELQRVVISEGWMVSARGQSNVVYDSEDFFVVYRTPEHGFEAR